MLTAISETGNPLRRIAGYLRSQWGRIGLALGICECIAKCKCLCFAFSKPVSFGKCESECFTKRFSEYICLCECVAECFTFDFGKPFNFGLSECFAFGYSEL